MMNYAYQFAISKYEILRINENHPMTEKKTYICQRGDDKGGERKTDMDMI